MTKGERKHTLAGGVGGVTVSIVAFQAVDPGSTPGQRILFLPHLSECGLECLESSLFWHHFLLSDILTHNLVCRTKQWTK